jgi:hypothetical protein
MVEPVLTRPPEPRRTSTQSTTNGENTVICELIRERQQVLTDRLEALQVTAQHDNGGYINRAELNALCEEWIWLARLAHAHLERLEASSR